MIRFYISIYQLDFYLKINDKIQINNNHGYEKSIVLCFQGYYSNMAGFHLTWRKYDRHDLGEIFLSMVLTSFLLKYNKARIPFLIESRPDMVVLHLYCSVF